MSEAQLTATALTALANLLLAGAAIAAAIAAFAGLSTWKEQNIWVADRDLARSLLKSLIRLDKVVARARHPMFWASETQKYTENEELEPGSKAIENGVERAHLARLNAVYAVYEEIEAILVEAEALWGNDYKADWEEIHRLLIEYSAQTRHYLQWNANESSNKDQGYFDSQESKRSNYDIVFANPSSENSFSNEFSTAISRLKSRLAERIGKRK